jgi:hypothetical protein
MKTNNDATVTHSFPEALFGFSLRRLKITRHQWIAHTYTFTPTERDHGALTKAHPIEARLRRHAATRKYQAARHHRPLQIGCVSTSTQRVSARTLHTSPALLMERHSGQVDDVIAHTANGPDACQVVFHVTSQHRASLGAIVAYPNNNNRLGSGNQQVTNACLAYAFTRLLLGKKDVGFSLHCCSCLLLSSHEVWLTP